jgi:hypothetical protein
VKETFPISVFKESVKFRLFPVVTISRETPERPPPLPLVHCPLIRPSPSLPRRNLVCPPPRPRNRQTPIPSPIVCRERADLSLALKPFEPSIYARPRERSIPSGPQSNARSPCSFSLLARRFLAGA